MKKYSLSLSQYIPNETKIKVYELCINNRSLFEEFVKDIKTDGNLFSDFAASIRIIEDTSNLYLRPKNQFRPIVTTDLKYKLYEVKRGILRIYLFHEEKTGRVIITGGKKDNQKEDIKAVKILIKDYYNENKK